jgi:hypothetical protein
MRRDIIKGQRKGGKRGGRHRVCAGNRLLLKDSINNDVLIIINKMSEDQTLNILKATANTPLRRRIRKAGWIFGTLSVAASIGMFGYVSHAKGLNES